MIGRLFALCIHQHRLTVYFFAVLVCLFAVAWRHHIIGEVFALGFPWILIGAALAYYIPKLELYRLQGASIVHESQVWLVLVTAVWPIGLYVYVFGFEKMDFSYPLTHLPEDTITFLGLTLVCTIFASLFRKNVSDDCFWLEYRRATDADGRNKVARRYLKLHMLENDPPKRGSINGD